MGRPLVLIASGTLMQTQILSHLPEKVAARLPGLATDAQRAIQFTRSTPGISVALVGMSRTQHVNENLETARVPPLNMTQFRALFKASASTEA